MTTNNAEKFQMALKLVEVAGMRELMLEGCKTAIHSMTELLTGAEVDHKVAEQFIARAEGSVDQLLLDVTLLMQERLTVEEMQAMIDLYSSPVGRSLLAKMPGISRDSMALGMRWGQNLHKETNQLVLN